MINFIISVSDFHDAITLKEWGLVDTHIEWAEKTVKSEGKLYLSSVMKMRPPLK